MTMLGAKCSRCCPEEGCSCLVNELPKTVTVQFSGKPGARQQGPPLLPITFDSCFGSGAAGYAVAPGGDPQNKGPISGVKLTDAGGGYAILGRRAPTITVTLESNSGSGATFAPTLASQTDSCSRPTWSIESIAITSGGEGYDGDVELTITTSGGDTTEVPAKATIGAKRSEPQQENPYSVSGGAEVELAWEDNGDGTWSVSQFPSIALVSGGSGYKADPGDFWLYTFGIVPVVLQLDEENDVVENHAALSGYMSRVAPTVSFTEMDSGEAGGTNGTGAVIDISVGAPELDDLGLPIWPITASIVNGGSGYVEFTDYARFSIAAPGGAFGGEPGFIRVNGVDDYGSITSLDLGDVTQVYGWDGVLASIAIDDGGRYYHRGEATGVTIHNGGKYYRSDPQLPAIVSKVDASVDQLHPSAGTGVQLSVDVNSNPNSAAFGKISAINVVNGGNGYTGWQWVYLCACEYADGDEYSVVAWRQQVRQQTAGEFVDTCNFIAPRCIPATTPSTLDSELLNARLEATDQTLGTRVERVELLAKVGVAGRDGWPIVGVDTSRGTLNWNRDWSYVDEDTNEIRHWPTPTVTVEQAAPSDGIGAVISASVIRDPKSPQFGRLTLAVENGGSGYLGNYVGSNFVTVTHRGSRLPPVVSTNDKSAYLSCGLTYNTTKLIEDCKAFSFEAVFGETAGAEVSAGGSLSPPFSGPNKCCGICHDCCPDTPSQLTVTFTREASQGFSWLAADQVGDLGRPFLDHNGQNAFGLACEAHEVEVVFDSEDLEEQLNCGPFEACVIGNFEDGGGWPLLFPGAPTVLGCPQGAEHIIESPPPSLTGPRIALNDGSFVRQHRTEMTRAVFSLNSFALNCNQAQVSFNTASQWIGYYRSPVGSTANDSLFGPTELGGVISNVPAHQKTTSHVLRQGKGCKNHPNNWLISEAEEGGPQQGGTFGTAQMFGRLPPGSNFLELRSGFYRRICHSYEIDVEFS